MVYLSKLLAVFFIYIFLPLSSAAFNSLDAAINEISWGGTVLSYNDEWIELYNNTDSEINLSGWTLFSRDNVPKISLAGKIPPKGFYLLERTDEETVPEIIADQIYSGALGNSGENLVLIDASGNLIDSVNCSSAWFAGDNFTKQTMERKDPLLSGDDPLNWQDSQVPGGTPKIKNSVIGEEEVKTAPEAAEKEPCQKEVVLSYPSGVILNEILPSPKDSDEENEWIEVFNQNDIAVNLSGWWITDEEGKTTVYIIPQKTEILPKGFLIFPRQTTKITLNNDGDAIDLVYPDGFLADTVSYKKAPLGQSYNRILAEGWEWNASLTPGGENARVAVKKSLPARALSEGGDKSSSDDQKSPTEGSFKNNEKSPSSVLLARLSSPFESKNSQRSFFVFLAALTTSVFSALIILSVKNKIKKIKNNKILCQDILTQKQ